MKELAGHMQGLEPLSSGRGLRATQGATQRPPAEGCAGRAGRERGLAPASGLASSPWRTAASCLPGPLRFTLVIGVGGASHLSPMGDSSDTMRLPAETPWLSGNQLRPQEPSLCRILKKK